MIRVGDGSGGGGGKGGQWREERKCDGSKAGREAKEMKIILWIRKHRFTWIAIKSVNSHFRDDLEDAKMRILRPSKFPSSNEFTSPAGYLSC